jgi:hypothetical protein
MLDTTEPTATPTSGPPTPKNEAIVRQHEPGFRRADDDFAHRLPAGIRHHDVAALVPRFSTQCRRVRRFSELRPERDLSGVLASPARRVLAVHRVRRFLRDDLLPIWSESRPGAPDRGPDAGDRR